jgi:hypothetical protein
MAAAPAEQMLLTAVIAAAGRQVVAAVLAELDRELADEEVRRAPYRVQFHERCGLEYAAHVASRHDSVGRVHEAFGANRDIDFADVFGPSGDWLTRIARDPMAATRRAR